jgi:hypothetical protein
MPSAAREHDGRLARGRYGVGVGGEQRQGGERRRPDGEALADGGGGVAQRV